jgi:hypothetical protein
LFCLDVIRLYLGVIVMCRNIRPLFNFEPPVTEDEVRAASLQFVRKISGFSKPSKANESAFLAAVDEIAEVSVRLLRSLETNAPPRNREEEAAKAKARSATRFAPERSHISSAPVR